MTDIIGPANAANAVTARPAETRTFSLNDSWFKDCSSATAEDGTEIQASFFNGIIALMRSIWRSNGDYIGGGKIIPEIGTSDTALLDAIQQLIQRAQMSYAVDTGTADALIVTLAPALKEYKPGVIIRVKAKFAVTGPATIDVNGLGEVDIKHPNGAALAEDDIVADGIAFLCFDGTVFQLVASHTDNVGGGGGGGVGFRVPYAVAAGTAAAITADYSPDTPTPVPGDLFSVKLTASITGATTFNPDGHGAVALKDMNGAALFANFAVTGDLLLMEFIGGEYRVLNKAPASTPNFMTPGAIGSLGLAFVDINGYSPMWDRDQTKQPSLGYVYGAYVFNIQGSSAAWPPGGGTPFTGVWRILSAFSLDSVDTTTYPRVPILLCQRIS